MNTKPTSKLIISNMAEVLYLLDRSNRIICAGMETTLEGTRVFSVTMEGERIEDDHSNYLSYCPCQMGRLWVAFSAVLQAIGETGTEEKEGGRL
jgi:hypothetical protein